MRFTPAICALLLAGCFPTRSTELACVVTQDCEDGNACTQGYCLPIDDPSGPDAAPQPDAPPADPACEDEWPDEPSIFSGCAFAKAPAITVGPTSSFDTTNGTWTGTTGDSGRIETVFGQQVRVLIVEGFTFPSGTLRVTGQYPLLVVSWGDIVLNGTVDASSNAADVLDPTKRGAGANSSLCPVLTPGITNNNGGSGGGGGGFGGAGSRGGNGGNENTAVGQPGGGIIAAPMLAGGCAGANGGLRVAGNDENQGGAGGGAVYFASKTAITGAGTIDVGGAGGQGARNDDDQNGNDDRGGGGGGGSGGFIGLEAPTISFSGVLAANGGGGGAGCDEGNGNNGADGGLTPALGAANGQNAGGSNGGNGGFNTTGATDAQNFGGDNGGGGGGGGGVGHIVRKPG